MPTPRCATTGQSSCRLRGVAAAAVTELMTFSSLPLEVLPTTAWSSPPLTTRPSGGAAIAVSRLSWPPSSTGVPGWTGSQSRARFQHQWRRWSADRPC